MTRTSTYTTLKSRLTSSFAPLEYLTFLGTTLLPSPSPFIPFFRFLLDPEEDWEHRSWRELMAERKSPLQVRAMSCTAEDSGCFARGRAWSRMLFKALIKNEGAKAMKLCRAFPQL